MGLALVKLEQQKWMLIEPSQIDSLRKDIEFGIARALETSNGEATVEDTLDGLRAGRTQLMMLWNDAGAALGVVLQILQFPRFKIARVLLLFGGNMGMLRDGIDAAEQWVKGQGCKFIEGWVGTESRERLFALYGYRPTYRILRKALT